MTETSAITTLKLIGKIAAILLWIAALIASVVLAVMIPSDLTVWGCVALWGMTLMYFVFNSLPANQRGEGPWG